MLIVIKMVYVSESICYFIRKGMDLHDLKQLCDTGYMISKNSKVEQKISPSEFLSPPIKASPPKSFIWGPPPSTFLDPKSSSPPSFRSGRTLCHVHLAIY